MNRLLFLLPLATALLGSTTPAHAANALWFSVRDEAAVVDEQGTQIDKVASLHAKTGETVNAARVRVTGDNVDDNTFLLLYYEDSPGDWRTAPGLTYASFEAGTDSLQWQPADLGSYASSGYSFELQLGFYNDVSDSFQLLASASSSYTSLVDDGHISMGGVSTQAQTPWAPTFTADPSVPEPAAAPLALLGVLALFRRRRPGKFAGRHSAVKTLAPALVILLAVSGIARAGDPADEIIYFCTVGPDTYADGSTVLDGENYMLAWTSDGNFDGLYADGTPVNPEERVLLFAPAQDGRLLGAIFEVPADLADSLRGGTYSIFLLDTRVQAADGTISPRPAVDNTLALVNGYGVVVEGWPVSGSQRPTGELVRSSNNVGYVRTAQATTAAPPPQGVEQPRVKAIRIENDRAIITFENLKGFVRVQGGATIDDIGDTVGPATETDGNGGDVEIVAPSTGADSGFFRVLRN